MCSPSPSFSDGEGAGGGEAAGVGIILNVLPHPPYRAPSPSGNCEYIVKSYYRMEKDNKIVIFLTIRSTPSPSFSDGEGAGGVRRLEFNSHISNPKINKILQILIQKIKRN